ncbi:MAG: ElyC/SanA/YdcF family protein [Aquaticitalea sp.]
MLILGSGNLETSVARAGVGYNIYQLTSDFDFIIVSGGCGAHNSSICEASVMADVLIDKGVPKSIIIKEEKSKNTAQNYCYSRDLRHADGTKIIHEGDELVVVSNHWHAMSVSGCFGDKDLAKSNYVIEGHIIPKQDDKTDYGAMYENCMNNTNYCQSVLWPKIDAAYSLEMPSIKKHQSRVHLFLDVLVAQPQDSTLKFSKIAEVFPDLPEFWKSNWDAAFYNTCDNLIYIFKGHQYIALEPNSSKIEKSYPKAIATLFSDLPEYWQKGNVDAAFFHPKTKRSYFFKGDQYVIAHYKRNEWKRVENPKKITDLVEGWPFKWSTGNIDAAYFNPQTDKVVLYRGQETLKLKFNGEKLTILGEASEKTSLEWPTELLGDRY